MLKPQDYSEKARRLQQAYDDFLNELGVLKEKRTKLVKKILQRIEQERIKKLLDEIKK